MMFVQTIFAENTLLQQGSTVSIKVNTDRNETIHNAFFMAFAAAGFKYVNDNSDYMLNVHITITPVTIPNRPFQYVQLELTANLIDNNGDLILPYSISWCDGHTNLEGAENRAFREVVKKIHDEYGGMLGGVL